MTVVLRFPVHVTLPNGTEHRPAKVHTHDGVVDVYVWNRDLRDAELVATIPGTLEPAGHRQWAVYGEHDPMRVADTGGCGCGHPLKRWSPPRPVRT